MERWNSARKGKRKLDQSDEADEEEEEEENDEHSKKKRQALLARVILEADMMDLLQKYLGPYLHRIVSEAVEGAFSKFNLPCRCSTNRIEGPDQRHLRLHFKSRLSLPIFTERKVEWEQGAAIHVALCDATTRSIVTSGPESCLKLDVVVLEGDFNNEDDEDWTHIEFEKQVLKERKGKRPLLIGDLHVTLKEGVGTLGFLSFTDNSSWVQSKKFRIGLKVASDHCDGIQIREAKTEAFAVKDHRGESYRKHYPPALDDEIWRLDNIGKGGSIHKRLNEARICTVKDFLRLLARNPQNLRDILGMSKKIWEALVDHAKTCVLNEKLHVYHLDDTRNFCIIFNDIYEVMGLIADADYYPAGSLSSSLKGPVDDLVKKAYDNWGDIAEYDGNAILNFKQNAAENQRTLDDTLNRQVSTPCLPIPINPKQPTVETGLPSSGINCNENPTATDVMHSQTNDNFCFPFGGTSSPLQNQPMGSSHQTQMLRNYSMGKLASGSPHFSISGSNDGFPSNLPNIFTSDDVLSFYGELGPSMILEVGLNHDNILQSWPNVSEDLVSCFDTTMNGDYFSTGTSSQQNCNQYEGLVFSSRKANPWLMLGALIMWRYRIRKKIANKRLAQLIPLSVTPEAF